MRILEDLMNVLLDNLFNVTIPAIICIGGVIGVMVAVDMGVNGELVKSEIVFNTSIIVASLSGFWLTFQDIIIDLYKARKGK